MLALLNIAILLQSIPHVCDSDLVGLICGSNESVITHTCSRIPILEKIREHSGVFVTHLLGTGVALLDCFLLNFHSVLIRSNREEHLVIRTLLQALEACNRVTVDRRVEMPDVWNGIDVEDWRHHTFRILLRWRGELSL